MRKGMEMAMWRWRSRRRGFVFRVLVLFNNTCFLEMNFFLEQWSENKESVGEESEEGGGDERGKG